MEAKLILCFYNRTYVEVNLSPLSASAAVCSKAVVLLLFIHCL